MLERDRVLEIFSHDKLTWGEQNALLHRSPKECQWWQESRHPGRGVRFAEHLADGMAGQTICEACIEPGDHVRLQAESRSYETYQHMLGALRALRRPVGLETLVYYRDHLLTWERLATTDSVRPLAFQDIWNGAFQEARELLDRVFQRTADDTWWDAMFLVQHEVETTVRPRDMVLFRSATEDESARVDICDAVWDDEVFLRFRLGFFTSPLPRRVYLTGKREHLEHVLRNSPVSDIGVAPWHEGLTPVVLETALGLWDPSGSGDLAQIEAALSAAQALLES